MMTIHMTVLCLHTFRAWLTKLRKCNLLFFKQENQPVFLSIYATILNFWYKVFFFFNVGLNSHNLSTQPNPPPSSVFVML